MMAMPRHASRAPEPSSRAASTPRRDGEERNSRDAATRGSSANALARAISGARSSPSPRSTRTGESGGRGQGGPARAREGRTCTDFYIRWRQSEDRRDLPQRFIFLDVPGRRIPSHQRVEAKTADTPASASSRWRDHSRPRSRPKAHPLFAWTASIKIAQNAGREIAEAMQAKPLGACRSELGEVSRPPLRGAIACIIAQDCRGRVMTPDAWVQRIEAGRRRVQTRNSRAETPSRAIRSRTTSTIAKRPWRSQA